MKNKGKYGEWYPRYDLVKQGMFHAPDKGSCVRRHDGWYVANDIRWDKIGILPNSKLCQPAVGPYPAADQAIGAFEKECERLQEQ